MRRSQSTLTYKTRAIWMRHFTDIEDLQQALRTFKETYRESEGLCGIPPRARAPQIRRKEWDDA